MYLPRYLCLAALVLNVPAAAALDRALVERCAKEPELRDQLYCLEYATKDYDNEDATDEGDWLRKSSVSPIDDSRNVHVHVIAETPFKGWIDEQAGALYLKCTENETRAFVFTGMAAQPERGKYNRATATLRYDQEEARTLVMNESSNHDRLFFPQPIAEIKRMMKHDEMLFRFTPHNATMTTTRFNLRGLEKAVQPLREACHW